MTDNMAQDVRHQLLASSLKSFRQLLAGDWHVLVVSKSDKEGKDSPVLC
jgi:hypothetical protein